MPITISFTPSWPPRLMICSSAGTIASPPSRPKRLVPVYFTSAELLEALGLDQLVEDGLLAFLGEADVLLLAFDAFLNPGLLRRRRDVHELDADLSAVRAAEDLQDLADGRSLEAEHAVDEDRTVEIGVGEAVGLGLQLAMHLALREAQRIEVGGEMAHDAISADQHQRANRVLCRAHRGDGRHVEARGIGAGLDAVTKVALGLAVVTGERRDEFAGRAGLLEILERNGPRRTLRLHLAGMHALLFQAFEEMPPFVADRAGVLLILRLHFLDVGGVGAREERGAEELLVQGLARHLESLGWTRLSSGILE